MVTTWSTIILLFDSRDLYLKYLGRMSENRSNKSEDSPRISLTTTGTTNKKVEKRKNS